VAAGLGCVPAVLDVASDCDARTLNVGELRVRRAACTAELIDGGEGRTQDWLVENAYIRAIFRHEGSALTQVDAGGGTLLDVAAVGEEDVLAEALPLLEGAWLTEVTVEPISESGSVGIDVIGAEGTVRWRLGVEDRALSVSGLDALWVLPGEGSERFGNVLTRDDGVLAVDGSPEDLGGAVRFEGAASLSVGAPADVFEAVWPEGQSVDGTSDGERVELLRDTEVLGWLPVEDGAFAGRVPSGVDGVRAIAAGHAPGDVEPVGSGVSLERGALGALAVRVVDDEGGALASTVFVRPSGSTDLFQVWPISTHGATLPLGAGSFELLVYSGFAHEFWHADEFVVQNSTGLSVVLDRAYDQTTWVLADVRLQAWPDRQARGFISDAFATAAAQGVGFAVCVARDEICTADVDARWASEIQGRSGSLTMTDAVGEIISWEWTANSKRPGHGAVDWTGQSAEDVLALAEGGPNQERLLVVNGIWLESAGPSYGWSPSPDAVRLDAFSDRVGLVEFAATGVDAWLGPYSWVSVDNKASYSAVDVERGIVSGATVATNGPWVSLSVDGAGPGETSPSTGAVSVQVEVAAPLWMGVYAAGLDVDGQTVATWQFDEVLDGVTTEQSVVELDFGVVQAWVLGTGADASPLSGERWAITSPVWVGQPVGTRPGDTAVQ